MFRSRTPRGRSLPLLLVLCLVAVVVPLPAGAQVWRKIKERSAAKAAATKSRIDSTLVNTADRAVDSTLEKGDRGAKVAIEKAGTALDTALSKTERGFAAAFAAPGHGRDPLAADLVDGRAVLSGLHFDSVSAEPAERPTGYLAHVAKVLAADAKVYLIEGHTAPSGDAAADQALSERRAAAVKARLIAAGVTATRLFSVGYGSSRPPAPGSSATDRLELVLMQ